MLTDGGGEQAHGLESLGRRDLGLSATEGGQPLDPLGRHVRLARLVPVHLDGPDLDVQIPGDVHEHRRIEQAGHRRRLEAQDGGLEPGRPQDRCVHGGVVLVLVVGGMGEDDVRLELIDGLLHHQRHLAFHAVQRGVGEVMDLERGHPEELRPFTGLVESRAGVAALVSVAHRDAPHLVSRIDEHGHRAATGQFEVVRVGPDEQIPLVGLAGRGDDPSLGEKGREEQTRHEDRGQLHLGDPARAGAGVEQVEDPDRGDPQQHRHDGEPDHSTVTEPPGEVAPPTMHAQEADECDGGNHLNNCCDHYFHPPKDTQPHIAPLGASSVLRPLERSRCAA
ncbi:hypothetical protein SDC9_84630 [bioreactor metagenome]|uniref:Uncharacterized protein n=1 Tax=bioreactor metagenome TaxID=1076179 RepID=A0A644ZBE2_9ZZZZ